MRRLLVNSAMLAQQAGVFGVVHWSRRVFKKAVFGSLVYSKMERAFRPVRRALGMPIVILTYHRVTESARDGLSVPEESFREQMSYLKEECTVLSLADALDRIKLGGRFPPRAVVITFDDGYLDNYTRAAPILRSLGLPATFFVTTGYIGTERQFPWDSPDESYRKMEWEHVAALRDMGFEIGSHTVEHVNLGECDLDTAARDLNDSMAELRRRLGLKRIPFAYPYGGRRNMRPEILELARRAGYSCCCSSSGGSNTPYSDPFNLLRINIGGNMTLLDFKAYIHFAGLVKPGAIWDSPKEPRRSSKIRRVMHVTYSVYYGGAEIVASNVIRQLYGPELHLSMTGLHSIRDLHEENTLADGLEAQSIPWRIIPKRSGIDWLLFWKLYRLFRAERVDIVHAHHLGQLIYCLPGAVLNRSKLLLTEHDCHSLVQRKYQRLERLLSRWTDRVTAVSTGIAEFMIHEIGIPREKVVTIVNGVDTDRFWKHAATPKAYVGLPDDTLVVGNVARLVPDKDQGTLLKAFARVAAREPRARLLVVGSGPKEAELHRLEDELGLRGRILWVGSRSDVAELVGVMDLFVLSSVREGLPLTLLEAMAAEKPVISTRVGDIERLIEDGKNGVLVPPQRPEKLAEAILEILNDPERGKRMAAAGRSLVLKSYSLEIMSEGYRRLYEGDIPS